MSGFIGQLLRTVPLETLLGYVLALLAPQITDLVKKAIPRLPAVWKLLVNGLIGAIVTGIASGDPAAGVAIAHLMGKAREVKRVDALVQDAKRIERAERIDGLKGG